MDRLTSHSRHSLVAGLPWAGAAAIFIIICSASSSLSPVAAQQFFGHNNNNNGFWRNWNVGGFPHPGPWVVPPPVVWNPPRPVVSPRDELECQQHLKDCRAVGFLAARLSASVINGMTLTLAQTLILSFDPNNDGCITRDEIIHLASKRGFTVNYLVYWYTSHVQSHYGAGAGQHDSRCPGSLSVNSLKKQPVPAVIDAVEISSHNMQHLVDYCNMDRRRYQTNCDCIQVPPTCRQRPFAATRACLNFNLTSLKTAGCPFTAQPAATTNNNNNTSTNNVNSIKAQCAKMQFGAGTNQALLKALCKLLMQNNNNINNMAG